MKLSVYSSAGEVVGDLELSDAVFDVASNVPLMHQAVVQQEANARVGTASTKTRAEIAGTRKKVYRQKGTGRARHGSRRVNLWTGGGVAFGPHPRSYEQHMPRKMRRQAIRSALSVKARDGQIIVLREIEGFGAPRTKDVVTLFDKLPLGGKVLVALDELHENFVRSARNIQSVSTVPATTLNTRSVLQCDYLLTTIPAIQAIERWLTPGGAAEDGGETAAAAPTARKPAARARKAAEPAAEAATQAPTRARTRATAPAAEEAKATPRRRAATPKAETGEAPKPARRTTARKKTEE